MNFSIIFPSRGRSALLANVFNSFWELADNPHLVEFSLVIDNDDFEMRDMIPMYKSRHPERKINVLVNNITPEIRKTGINIHKMGFSPAAKNSIGK